MVVFALICWPRWLEGVDRNWEFSVEISFLIVLSDWSYHLRADFCFLDGEPLLRNLTSVLFPPGLIWRSLQRWSQSGCFLLLVWLLGFGYLGSTEGR